MEGAGSDPTEEPTPAADSPRLSRGALAARIVAVLAGVAVIGGAIALAARDTDEPQAVGTERATTTTAPTGPTGFYVPHGLPEGWFVTRVSVEDDP